MAVANSKAITIIGSAILAGLLVGGGIAMANAATSGSDAGPVTQQVTVNRSGAVTIVTPGKPTITAPPLHEISLENPLVVLNSAGEALASSSASVPAYVRSADLVPTGPPPANPSDAAAATASRVDSNGDIYSPVYAADGITILGKIKTGHVEFK